MMTLDCSVTSYRTRLQQDQHTCSDDTMGPAFDDSEPENFLEFLRRFTSMINQLAPQEIDQRADEEPKTPVSAEFDKVFFQYERDFAVGGKRAPDGQEPAPCTNSRCFIINQALAMAMTTLRDVLRAKRQQSAIWQGLSQPYVEEIPFRDPWQNVNDQGYSTKQIKEMVGNAFAHLRKEQEDFAKEMLKREDEREVALYNASVESAANGVKWEEAVGGVPPRLRRSISDIRSSLKDAIMTDGKDSVWAGHWSQLVNRGVQCDLLVHPNDDDVVAEEVKDFEDDAHHDKARNCSSGRLNYPAATEGVSSTSKSRSDVQGPDGDAPAQNGIMWFVSDVRNETSEHRKRMLEDEGVVFDLPHIDRNMMEEIPPLNDEASLEGRWAYEISGVEAEEPYLDDTDTDIEGIQRWAEETSLQALRETANTELQRQNAELQKRLDELESRKSVWLQLLKAREEALQERQDLMDRLAARGQTLPGKAKDDASKTWTVDPLRSYLTDNVSAWAHILAYIIYEIMKTTFHLVLGSAGLAQKWNLRVRGRRIGLLDKVKPLGMRVVVFPSTRDVAYVAQHFGIMVTVQTYFFLQQERDVWFQANGLTRKHFLGYSIQYPHRWRSAEPTTQGCPHNTRNDVEGLYMFLTQFSGVWMLYVLNWLATALTSGGLWSTALQKARRCWSSATDLWGEARQTVGGLLAGWWIAVVKPWRAARDLLGRLLTASLNKAMEIWELASDLIIDVLTAGVVRW